MVLTYNQLAQTEKPLSKSINKIEQIVVVGCGGTGSQLIPDLSRALKFANHCEQDCKIVLIDGDIVESKNIERQNFIQKDIGKNKAEVLAKRYGQVFGITIEYKDKHIESERDLKTVLNHQDNYCNGNNIIISCADNHYVRRIIHNMFSSHTHDLIWIDSGNEDTFGQVVFGFQPMLRGYGNTNGNVTFIREQFINNYLDGNFRPDRFPIPDVCEIFPEILEAQKPTERAGCAVVQEERPQNILINRLAATAIMSYVYPCLYRYEERVESSDGGEALIPTNIINHYMTLFNIGGEFTKRQMYESEFKQIFKSAYRQLSLT